MWLEAHEKLKKTKPWKTGTPTLENLSSMHWFYALWSISGVETFLHFSVTTGNQACLVLFSLLPVNPPLYQVMVYTVNLPEGKFIIIITCTEVE